MGRKFWIALIVLAICAMASSGCKKSRPGQDSPKSETDEIRSSAQTRQAADFELKDQAGKVVRLSDYAGKIVVLEWVNYDCPFVLPHYEKGDMEAMAAKYKDKNVVWIAINSTHYADAAQNLKFAQKYMVTYPILDDHDGTVGRLYGATNTPHIFIIKDGKVLYNGAFDNAHGGTIPQDYKAYVDDALTAILQGKEVDAYFVKPVGCTVKYAK